MEDLKMGRCEGGMTGQRPLEGKPSAVGGLRLEAEQAKGERVDKDGMVG